SSPQKKIEIEFESNKKWVEWRLPLTSINTQIYDICYQLKPTQLDAFDEINFRMELRSSGAPLALVEDHKLFSENNHMVNLCIGDLANLDLIDYANINSKLVARITSATGNDL